MKKQFSRALLPALLCASFAAAAGEPDTEAVEYYNTRLNHYFVTATAAEALAIDSGMAGEGWVRTGRSFQAWLEKSAAPADAQPVCRFYSSAANSHFYTASAGECASLKAQEALERNSGHGVRGWAYEGIAFHIQAPVDGACPAGTTKLERVYNNGFASGEGSNHRFVDDDSLTELMADRAWTVEGAVMCAQAKTTGTSANLHATATSFESLAGTWSGNARWKSENTGMETRATEPLSLTLDADGAITGEGYGCTFTGQLTSGDGFRSHFKGTLSAAGCTVESFNGDYQWLHLEHFGADTLMVRMKREAGPVEAMIDARLTTGDGTPPPSPPAVEPGFGSVEGSWVGTVAWSAKRETGAGDEEEETEVSANKPLTLDISATGAITGSGFGCAFTGTLLPRTMGERLRFTGSVEAAGCTEALFNGIFAKVSVEPKMGGRIEVELERKTEDAAGKTEVEIEGTLEAAS